MQKIDLLPCPFCGKLETLRMIYIPAEKRECVYHVVCDAVNGGCGASTGWNHETPEEAAKEWNTRASGWITCNKKMPEDDEEVLFAVAYPWDKGKKPKVALGRHYTKNEKGWWTAYYGAFLDYEVTHWMPLPAPPEVTNNVD